jgi:hypothetical protein
MAEPSTTTPVEAATPERDRLLATKLHVPRPRPGFLTRPRLLERINQGTAGALTLVCAPAGFGENQPSRRLGPAQPAAGGLAVAGRGRQ